MYGKMSGISLGAGGAAGTAAINVLPFTGLPLWMAVVMAFTLVAAGAALLRLIPRQEG